MTAAAPGNSCYLVSQSALADCILTGSGIKPPDPGQHAPSVPGQYVCFASESTAVTWSKPPSSTCTALGVLFTYSLSVWSRLSPLTLFGGEVITISGGVVVTTVCQVFEWPNDSQSSSKKKPVTRPDPVAALGPLVHFGHAPHQ